MKRNNFELWRHVVLLTLCIAYFVGAAVYFFEGSAVPSLKSTAEFGWWQGYLNGLYMPLTFLGEVVFDKGWNIYQSVNNGNLYNFGFLLGIGSTFALARRS